MSKSKSADAVASNENSTVSDETPDKKRKRTEEAGDLEIDVNLPEPPSKKAQRLERKQSRTKLSKKDKKAPSEFALAAKDLAKAYFDSDAAQSKPGLQKRSDYSIWIGNLPWTATRDDVRDFLRDQGGVEGKDIVRLHLPAPNDAGNDRGKRDSGRPKAQNKGFAYVDFTTKEVLEKALALSEKLLSGRAVLIKNAKNFEGRPSQQAQQNGAADKRAAQKEPTKRVFVGNLAFDTTREDLREHFAHAGEVEDVFLATFEDTGKCKGFGWVRFAEVEVAEKAVKGYFKVDRKDSEGSEEEASDTEEEGDDNKKSKSKRRKQRIIYLNRLHGRDLRCEFAEDAQTRYKKRFSKDRDPSTVRHDANADANAGEGATGADAIARDDVKPKGNDRDQDKEQRREQRRKRHDARTIAPGQANANKPRASGAIVAGSGRKMTFDP